MPDILILIFINQNKLNLSRPAAGFI